MFFKKKVQNTINDKLNNSKHKTTIHDLKFPIKLEKLSRDDIFNAIKFIRSTVHTLNYKDKDLHLVEWHTWQVGIILFYLKNNRNFLLKDINEIPHSIKVLNHNELEHEYIKILEKYQNTNIQSNRDTLSKEVIWSVKEIFIIIQYNNIF